MEFVVLIVLIQQFIRHAHCFLRIPVLTNFSMQICPRFLEKLIANAPKKMRH